MDKECKIERPTEQQYRNLKIGLALSYYAPPINPCRECGWPVISGYCCTTCGSAEP
jgi:hypothetical protein